MPSGQAQPCPTSRTSSAVVPRQVQGLLSRGLQLLRCQASSPTLTSSGLVYLPHVVRNGRVGRASRPHSHDHVTNEVQSQISHAYILRAGSPKSLQQEGQLYCDAQARCRAYSPEWCSLLGAGSALSSTKGGKRQGGPASFSPPHHHMVDEGCGESLPTPMISAGSFFFFFFNFLGP